MKAITIVVLTENEEHNIRECLESAKWADEIIVVDAGSSDATVRRARKYTRKVFVRPWQGFGAARNFAVKKARGEWIFWLDADERIPPGLTKEIRETIAGNPLHAGFSVPRKAFFLGKWIRHCGWYPGRVVRLFKRGQGHFSDERVHEKLVVDGVVGELREDLLHYTDPSLKHYFAKFDRYTSLASEELVAKGRKFSVFRLLLNPVWTFWRMFVLRRGFLDGLHGFVLSVLSAGYVFVKYAKLWERTEVQGTNHER